MNITWYSRYCNLYNQNAFLHVYHGWMWLQRLRSGQKWPRHPCLLSRLSWHLKVKLSPPSPFHSHLTNAKWNLSARYKILGWWMVAYKFRDQTRKKKKNIKHSFCTVSSEKKKRRRMEGTWSGDSCSKCFIRCSVVQLQMRWGEKWSFKEGSEKVGVGKLTCEEIPCPSC